MTKVCLKCKSEFPENLNFCDTCGKKLVRNEQANIPQSKYCVKCDKGYPPNRNFCDNCGAKLSLSEEKSPNKESLFKKSQSLLSSLFSRTHGVKSAIFLAMILTIVVLPTKVVTYQIEVPYLDTETHLVDISYIEKEQYTVDVPYESVEEYRATVPYETTEFYIESAPYQESQSYAENSCNQQDIKYRAEWVKCQGSGSVLGFTVSNGISSIKLTNIDTEGGTFTVQVGFKTSDDFVSDTQQKFIGAGASETFSKSTSSGFENCDYKVTSVPKKNVCGMVQKEKTVTKYKDVMKQKPATQYRDETKYHTVTKMRTETREREVRKTRVEPQAKEVQKSRVETHFKEVNWLFGFNPIFHFYKQKYVKYSLQWISCTKFTSPSSTGHADVRVTNLDGNYGGEFIVTLGYKDGLGQVKGVQVSEDVPPGSSKEIGVAPMPGSFSNCAYSPVLIPSRMVGIWEE